MPSPTRRTKPVSTPAIKIDQIELHAHRALRKWLRLLATKPLLKKRIPGLQSQDFHVDLSVISAPRMRELNEQYRKKDEPTDVLSFPADEFFQIKGLLGDIVLCGPVILKQAKEAGHTWKNEVDVLLVHGLLHLLHFDHEKSAKDAQEMHKWEEKILGVRAKKGLIQRSSVQSARFV